VVVLAEENVSCFLTDTLNYVISYFLKYRIFSNLIRASFLPPCIVRTARTPALSLGQTSGLDRESNPHLTF
jgi:hypothetical protein